MKRLSLAAAASALAAFISVPAQPQTQAQTAWDARVPVSGPFAAPSKAANPLDNLPARTRVLTSFGERAVFSPDGTKVAFIERAYGDAFEIDLKTGRMRNLTAHLPNPGFLRVHYMADGSFLLLGPRIIGANKEETRAAHVEMWWMDAKAEGQAFPLDQTVFEGLAASPISSRVAWQVVDPRVGVLSPKLPLTVSLMTGRVVLENGRPRLADVRKVVTRDAKECMLEAQDWFDSDRKLTSTCYVMNRSGIPGAKPVAEAQVYVVDTATGAMEHIPTPLELYAEAEGIFLSGRHTTTECGNDQAKGLDICVLELKPGTPDAKPGYWRITFAQDYGDYRFSNPQISRDGKLMAFQIGLAAEEAGSGRGILLMDLPSGL